MINLFTVELLSKVNQSVAVTAQTAIMLHDSVKKLPSLLESFIVCANYSKDRDTSIKNALVWLKEVLQHEAEVSQKASAYCLSMFELNEREHELCDWITEQGLEEYRKLVPTFLEAGLVHRDFETLMYGVKDVTVLPLLLDFLGSILTMKLMAHGITSELKRIFALIDLVVADKQTK